MGWFSKKETEHEKWTREFNAKLDARIAEAHAIAIKPVVTFDDAVMRLIANIWESNAIARRTGVRPVIGDWASNQLLNPRIVERVDTECSDEVKELYYKTTGGMK